MQDLQSYLRDHRYVNEDEKKVFCYLEYMDDNPQEGLLNTFEERSIFSKRYSIA
jgi:hypothetical protein